MTDIRWIFDPDDHRAHVLADADGVRPDVVVTMCGRHLPATASVFDVAPSLAVCQICEPASRFTMPAPQFPTHY